jgi:hypothetical protein
MSGQKNARFDVSELHDRVASLRSRFDEFRGRL